MNLSSTAPHYVILSSIIAGVTSNAYALEIKLGQTYSELPLDQSGTLTSAKPSGSHISLSHDINESFRVHLDYIDWDKTKTSGPMRDIAIDSSSYAATLSYFVDNLAISANYTYWQSDYSESYKQVPSRDYTTHAPSYGLAIGYGIFLDDWIIEPSFSLQYNQWRYRNNELLDGGLNAQFLNSLEDETVVLSALLTASKVIQLTPDTYFLAGGVIRWNEIFEPENNKPAGVISFAGRRSYNHHSNDDFAEMSFYVTYDITSQWLVELDTSIAFLPEDTYPSISWRVGYRF